MVSFLFSFEYSEPINTVTKMLVDLFLFSFEYSQNTHYSHCFAVYMTFYSLLSILQDRILSTPGLKTFFLFSFEYSVIEEVILKGVVFSNFLFSFEYSRQANIRWEWVRLTFYSLLSIHNPKCKREGYPQETLSILF